MSSVLVIGEALVDVVDVPGRPPRRTPGGGPFKVDRREPVLHRPARDGLEPSLAEASQQIWCGALTRNARERRETRSRS